LEQNRERVGLFTCAARDDPHANGARFTVLYYGGNHALLHALPHLVIAEELRHADQEVFREQDYLLRKKERNVSDSGRTLSRRRVFREQGLPFLDQKIKNKKLQNILYI
jgi:hypothetical protein